MAEQNLGTVLVVGAGIGGIKAAIDLAERGCRVILAESSPALGGILSRLDYQFPNNHCGLCRMLPAWERDSASGYCMRKGLFHENIRILPMTELTDLQGEAGRFQAGLRTRPRGVDPELCIGCGRCEEVCPVELEDGFNEGMGMRKAVYREVPHNVPFSYVIDTEHCTKCGECVEVCPTEAISLEGTATESIEEVGAVILAPGCGLYEPGPPDAYQYNALPDVITSLELERLLSGTGPTSGKLLRPSTGKPVRSVAWIQCVGSRNSRHNQDFCSSICCMFALKESLLIKERHPETQTAVFYMDMRAYGKEGYRYQLQAEAAGTELIRCRIHEVEAGSDGRPLLKHYLEGEGKIRERAFDLVVLSTGQASTPEMRSLARVAGVELNAAGFAPGRDFDPVDTNRPGVFWCGSATGLKDITETVLQAEAAAVLAAPYAGAPPTDLDTESDVTRDVSWELPRVGVLLCRCLGGQDQDLPWQEIRKDLASHPNVDRVVEADRLCRSEGFEEAAQQLAKQPYLNRLVIGACAPYVYDRRLRRLGTALGLSEELVEVVDLRGIGLGNGEPGEKRRLVDSTVSAAVLKQKRRDFPGNVEVSAVQEVVVVGGGLAGMTASLTLADSGIQVNLLEREDQLGGETRRRRYSLDGTDPIAFLQGQEDQVRGHERIQVHTSAEIQGLEGEPGRFAARLRSGGREHTISCGALILATGAREAQTTEYEAGRSERILRQGDLESRLGAGELSAKDLRRVVMIQCAGSRDPEGRAYCSRICCASALKNAARILEVHPEADIYVLYRDLMAYGFMESRYRELREQGVQFITYRRDQKPEVEVDDDKILVRFQEPVLGRSVHVHPDLLVLSTGVEPPDNHSLAQVLGLELNQDGFFQEMDPKWRPVDANRPGIFVCGMAHSPRNMAETVIQARAAAMRAVNLLGRSVVPASRAISGVRHVLCSLCETCIAVCPFEARIRDRDRIRVIPSACQGCGLCAAACPNGAAWLPMFTDRQAMGMIEGLMD